MSNLIDHAKRELAALGYNTTPPEKSDDPNDWMAKGVLDIVGIFAEQGHSGSSAGYMVGVLEKLLRFENLTPLTNDPAEWYRHEGNGPDDTDFWQNTRNGEAFSADAGATYYLLSERVWSDETDSYLPPTMHTSAEKVTV